MFSHHQVISVLNPSQLFVLTCGVCLATTPSQSGETGLAASGGLHSPSPGALDASFQSEPREGDIVFKSFTFYPDLPLRIDYHGKRISIEQVRKT